MCLFACASTRVIPLYVCVLMEECARACAVQHAESCGRCVDSCQPDLQLELHPCMIFQEDKMCVNVCVLFINKIYIYLLTVHLSAFLCGLRAYSATDPLCCIAAGPAHPEVAVVLQQGTLPRSQQVNPPHLHDQPTPVCINSTSNPSAVRHTVKNQSQGEP